MNDTPSKKEKAAAFLLGIGSGLLGLVIVAAGLYQLPSIQERVGWRVDFALTYLRGVVDPVEAVPTVDITAVDGRSVVKVTVEPVVEPAAATLASPGVLSSARTPTVPPTPSPTSIPGKISLIPPEYEEQELNNCGPATLAMYLRYFGWQGNQATIASMVKPKKEDRNVNVEELVAYVNTQVPGLEIQYRVGGDIAMLKEFLAAGFPVMIEESFIMEESYWPNDDRWAGHYLLVTGYDDKTESFTAQDTFLGPDLSISYAKIDERWKSFNRVYLLVYPPEQRPVIQAILGDQWDVDANRRHALELAQKETEVNPDDAFAWFNVGTNLVYFENYSQAAAAYDKARSAGLPQRMLRYQFGPFFAYFQTNRIKDLLALTEYALKRTPNAEEAKMWRGWAMYRQGNRDEAERLFFEALAANPLNPDVQYAVNFLRDN